MASNITFGCHNKNIMSQNLSSDSVSQKRTLESLLAGRVAKRPKVEDLKELQQAALHLLHRHQDLSGLLSEAAIPRPSAESCVENARQEPTVSEDLSSALAGSLLLPVLKQKADRLGVSVEALSVRTVLERLRRICDDDDDDDDDHEAKEDSGVRRVLLTSRQRVRLRSLLLSTRELLSLGAFCPKLFWTEYSKHQTRYKLEVAHHFDAQDILSIKYILESDEEARVWVVAALKALCSRMSEEEERDTVLSSVVGLLVGTGFEEVQGPSGPSRRSSASCCSILDDMLSWLLDSLDGSHAQPGAETAAETWIRRLDASLCGASASPAALRRFFTHSLTRVLTHKPRLKVSDAIATQSEWSFAKTGRLPSVLFRKLAIVFSVEDLLHQLHQVLETQEVNWQQVLCFLSTLLVFNPDAQPCLRDMLGRLLTSAFEGYDLENMITAFLLARQGALEGPGFFPSYSDWFKRSFGGHSGYHGSSKKSLLFLLKFLSDLVPFDPPQYLKVHIQHPPFVAVKHRGLLQEYVSLAKTRLADLQVPVEDMSMFAEVSGAAGEPGKCQALLDVEKALSLFKTTGRISATVMEASIFRRTYFLNRFLPALLSPRPLPLKADLKMSFIDALRKAEKIPAGQLSSYVEACQRLQNKKGLSSTEQEDSRDGDPVEVLSAQLTELRKLVPAAEDGELSAQLARISHTLGVIVPDRAGHAEEPRLIQLHVDGPPSCRRHVQVVDSVLRTFCQCLLDAPGPPNRQSQWAAQFVNVLLSHTELVSVLTHRLWDLFHNQGSSLTTSHVLGLAALLVHLRASSSLGPLVQTVPCVALQQVPLTEALSAALLCDTRDNMLFCVRMAAAAVCYGICRGQALPLQELQAYIPTGLVKKLLHLVPRLVPEARGAPPTGAPGEPAPEDGWLGSDPGLWGGAADETHMAGWRSSALQLWRNPTFGRLAQLPQYQLSLSEWLAAELRVQRNKDLLPDPDRQEYQRWACMDHYLSSPVDQGGCGGDMRALCTRMLSALLDQQEVPPQDFLSNRSAESSGLRPEDTGTCLPDILSRLQELVYEMQLDGHRAREEVCHFLFEVLSARCSSSGNLDSLGVSDRLRLQQTLHAWNRVLLALPAELFVVAVRNADERWTLDFSGSMEHINQYQRRVCSPAAVLPYHVTSHLLRGMLKASTRCARSSVEVNRAWWEVSQRCPLLLVSATRWWGRLAPMLTSVWQDLRGEDPLPELLKTIAHAVHWARNSQQGASCPPPPPTAPALLLAASLHLAWGGRRGLPGGQGQAFRELLKMLAQRKDQHCTQVLVFLLFFCVTDILALILHPEEAGRRGSREMCADLLTVLSDCPDWHLIFRTPPADQGLYQAVTMATLEEYTRLRSLAFYSLLPGQSPELLKKAAVCPGFLYTAVLCYASLFHLFLDGDTPTLVAEAHIDQTEPSQILGRARRFLLSTITQTPPTALSSAQLSQLGSLCAELDQEVSAALSSHLGPRSLSQEMDFL